MQAIAASVINCILLRGCIWHTMYFQLGCRVVVNKDEWVVLQTLNCQSVHIHKGFVHKSEWGKLTHQCLCVRSTERECFKARMMLNWNVYEIQITLFFLFRYSPFMPHAYPSFLFLCHHESFSQHSSDVKRINYSIYLSCLPSQTQNKSDHVVCFKPPGCRYKVKRWTWMLISQSRINLLIIWLKRFTCISN